MKWLLLIAGVLLAFCVPAAAQWNGCPAGFCSPASARVSTPFGITFASTANNTTAGTSFSFASQGIGTADATRIVVVGIAHGITSGITVSSVTIGGNAATQAVGCGTISGGGSNTDIWYLPVPTGTTATIVVNLSGTQARAAIEVYSVVGTGAAFSSCGNNSAPVGVTLATTASVPAGGGAIGVVNIHASGAAGTITGVNLTIDQNGTAFGNSTIGSGNNATASGSTVFTFNWTTSTDSTMSLATFSP